MRFELKLLIITGYEHFAEFRISDVTDQLDTVDLFYLLMITDGHCEQQFTVPGTFYGVLCPQTGEVFT